MDEKTREELLELLKQCNPRQRSTIIQAIEGHASEDNIGYIKEELAFLEPDMTTRQVTFMSSRLCDCGKLISAKNPLTGVCQYSGCSKFTCSECSRVCIRCKGFKFRQLLLCLALNGLHTFQPPQLTLGQRLAGLPALFVFSL